MLSSILIGSLNLSYQLKYFSLTFYGKQQNFSLTKRRKKVDFASLFLPTKQQKKKKTTTTTTTTENAIPAMTKKTQTLV